MTKAQREALSMIVSAFDAMRVTDELHLFVAGWCECDRAEAERRAKEAVQLANDAMYPATARARRREAKAGAR